MIDPDQYAVLVQSARSDRFSERTDTDRVDRFVLKGDRIEITYSGSAKSYTYRYPKARILRASCTRWIESDDLLVVRDERWNLPRRLTVFTDVRDPSFMRVRVNRSPGSPGKDHLLRAGEVRWVQSAACEGTAADVLRYWRRITRELDAENPLRKAHERMDFIHPDSALAAYLEGRNRATSFPHGPVILPFRSNEDQREAVEKALHNQVSVIDGPPGTGKTETILNLIANILLVPGRTVGVVSFGNAAVENVKDKLDEAGYGFVAARVGKRNVVSDFLENQGNRALRLEEWLARRSAPSLGPAGEESAGTVPHHPAADMADRIEQSEQRLREVWETTRGLARVRNRIDAYVLEAAHFERRVDGEDLPDLDDLPLLRKGSGRILDYLAETTVRPDPPGGARGLVSRVRRYFRYGRLRNLDPRDASTILRVERAFYSQRIEELRREERRLQRMLDDADADAAEEYHRRLSGGVLDRALRRRYLGGVSFLFDDQEGSVSRCTREFLTEYPVVLTTCHSIRRNLAEGTLLDWVHHRRGHPDGLAGGLVGP